MGGSMTGRVAANEGGYWLVETEDGPGYLSRLHIPPFCCNIKVEVGMRVKLHYTINEYSGLWRIVAELPGK